MSMRGGDADALRVHERLMDEEAYSQTLTDAETLSDGTIDHDQEHEQKHDEACKHRILLTYAETRVGDLSKRLKEIREEHITTYARAQAEKKRADEAEAALGIADPEELRAMRQQMLQAIEERDAAFALSDRSKQEAEQAKVAEEHMRGTLQVTRNLNRKLTADLQEACDKSTKHDETELSHLCSMIATRNAKIEQLAEKNERLAAEHFATTETLKKSKKDSSKDSGDLVFLKARNENLQHDIQEQRARVALYERENGRLQSDNARLLAERNGSSAYQHTVNGHDDRLASENNRLKRHIADHNDKLSVLRSNIAYYITQLDVSFAGWRLFDCVHNSFQDIPDGANSTRDTSDINTVVMEFLKDWVNDVQFVKDYNRERRTILQHHRAHERAVQGRGVASFRIKNEFVKLDEKRGIPIKY